MFNNKTKRTLERYERRAVMVDAIIKSLDLFTFHQDLSFNDMVANGLKPLAEAMGVNCIVCYRLAGTENEQFLEQMYRWDSSKGGLTDKSLIVLPNNRMVTNDLKALMQNICINRRFSDMPPEEIAFMNAFGIKSFLIVPVFTHDKFWGGIFFQDHVKERYFDSDCMDLYRTAARLCANAVINAEITLNTNDFEKPAKSREKMLETLIKTAIVFLSRSETLADNMMTAGVSLIADMVKIDKFSVWRNFTLPDGLRASQIYHWNRESDDSTIPLSSVQNVAYNRFASRLEEFFLLGESINCPVSLFPETSVLKSFDIKSAFITPIFINNALWGFVIFADCQHERRFDEVSVEMMRSAAFFIANTVIRSEIEREVADENEFNRVLFETTPIGLVLFDDHFNILDCNVAMLTMHGVTRQYFIDNFYNFSPEYQPDGSISHDKIHNIMNQALCGENQVIEWMHLSQTGESIPCEITMTRVIYKGKYIGLAYVYDLRNVKTMEKDIQRLESVVDFDALTSIGNRRFFDKNLKQIMKSLSRSASTLSVMMIDIDFFKKYNDAYGHIEGDKCLKTVAEALANGITRANDFIARYGGEEFVVVLPHTDEKGARIIARKLHENVQKCNIPHDKNDAAKHVTISIGVATGIVSLTYTGDDFIKQADKMLYISKQNGRNRSSYCQLEPE